jgi:hypothetical protein
VSSQVLAVSAAAPAFHHAPLLQSPPDNSNTGPLQAYNCDTPCWPASRNMRDAPQPPLAPMISLLIRVCQWELLCSQCVHLLVWLDWDLMQHAR